MSKEGCTFVGVLPKKVSKTFLVVFSTGRNSTLRCSNMSSFLEGPVNHHTAHLGEMRRRMVQGSQPAL